MLRALVLLVLAGCAWPAFAAAELPPAHPPGASPAGIKLSWPLKGKLPRYEPGKRLTVKVASPRRRVKLSIDIVSADGRAVRTVARRTLRRGSFRVTLGAGLYALRLSVAGRRYWSWVQIGEFCLKPGTSATLRLGASVVAPGEELPYEIVNTSDGCLGVGLGNGFQQPQPDGTWATVSSGQAFTLQGYFLGPGQTYAKRALIPANFAPGSYRLIDHASVAGAPSGTPDIALAADFQVASRHKR